jgi:hypothetical protein
MAGFEVTTEANRYRDLQPILQISVEDQKPERRLKRKRLPQCRVALKLQKSTKFPDSARITGYPFTLTANPLA